MLAVRVAVQSEFTVHDPVRVSLAKPPSTFLASVPEIFPAASTLALATAAPGTGPVGRIRVPVRVSPQFPAALAFEQWSAACAADAKPMQSMTTEMIISIVRAMLRFMRNLLMDRIRPLPGHGHAFILLSRRKSLGKDDIRERFSRALT